MLDIIIKATTHVQIGVMVSIQNNIFNKRKIWKARKRISRLIYRTPLIYSHNLSSLLNNQIYLKMECWQKCGCFKVRGAINYISSLTPKERSKGLVTASSGNHALAVAYASSIHGNPPTRIYIPENADPAKIKKINSYKSELVYSGHNFQEAYETAKKYVKKKGSTFIHSNSDPKVIAGQGTIGLEIIEDLPLVDAIIVPIGGGGLVSGISVAAKTFSENVKIYGVEPIAAPGAYMSLRENKCYETLDIKDSIAEGLLGGFGRLPFQICKETVDNTFLVEDSEIIKAMRKIQEAEQVMVEPASSVGLAALMSGRIELTNKIVVLVITSRNIEASRYNQLINTF
jgi:threonine dehydratase